MRSALEIEEQAARWLARRQEQGWSAADQAGFDAWISACTAHEVAYLRLEYGWRQVDRLAALRAPPALRRDQERRGAHLSVPAASHGRGASVRRWRPLTWGACAAALFAAMALLLSYTSLLTSGIYVTEVGGHEIVPLPDGSIVELNTDTRVRTELTENARNVWLERGEAYFEVAHDPARPFIVYAGSRRVTVLGTKFSVRLDPAVNRIRLAVAEGRIRLEELEPTRSMLPMVAVEGDRVIAEGGSTLVEPLSLRSVATELSWRQGMLFFDQTKLGQAAEEFNRYNRKKLVVEGAAADIRIGGRFEATNVDAFTRLLERGFGLDAETGNGEIRISN